ncbi:MAG: hypothetical protein KUF82_04825 [Candidatus Thiodiazotropha sp. (ex Ctena orbiculata)]|nr:hypothetical protein [Candidatus Thiodiazotropha taylori]
MLSVSVAGTAVRISGPRSIFLNSLRVVSVIRSGVERLAALPRTAHEE